MCSRSIAIWIFVALTVAGCSSVPSGDATQTDSRTIGLTAAGAELPPLEVIILAIPHATETPLTNAQADCLVSSFGADRALLDAVLYDKPIAGSDYTVEEMVDAATELWGNCLSPRHLANRYTNQATAEWLQEYYAPDAVHSYLECADKFLSSIPKTDLDTFFERHYAAGNKIVDDPTHGACGV